MTFALYLIGFLIFVAGLAYAANLVGIGSTWIAVGVITLLGIGIFTGVTRTRHKDTSET